MDMALPREEVVTALAVAVVLARFSGKSKRRQLLLIAVTAAGASLILLWRRRKNSTLHGLKSEEGLSTSSSPPRQEGKSPLGQLVDDALADVEQASVEQAGTAPKTRSMDLMAQLHATRTKRFEAAARPLINIVPGLVETLDDCRALVQARRGEWPSSLSDDQACALALYTDMSSEKAYYRQLNAIQREEDWPRIMPFLPMLKLQILALKKLPKAFSREQGDAGAADVWRGVKLNLIDQYAPHHRLDGRLPRLAGDWPVQLHDSPCHGRRAAVHPKPAAHVPHRYPHQSFITWWPFSSTTRSMEMLEQPTFLGTEGERTPSSDHMLAVHLRPSERTLFQFLPIPFESF